MKRTVQHRRGIVLFATLVAWTVWSPAHAAARGRKLGAIAERLAENTATIVAAERLAGAEIVVSDASLAEDLLTAQLALREGNDERAAIRFLDLVENHADTPAGRQAVYYLGVALTNLGMETWAVEQFSRVLRDASVDGRRFHQRAVARLFDLAVPRRAPGFAHQPGLAATPELRSRLQTVGASARLEPLTGYVSQQDAEKLVNWALSFPDEEREAELRYAHGRYLYLVGRYEEAQAELDRLNPLDIPLSRGGTDARWRIRAAYIAAASSAASVDLEDALQRFSFIAQARPRDSGDRQIVELAVLAVARIHQENGDFERAVAAYRTIGRDSSFFMEALYESAWALLGAKQFEQAVAVLDQLLLYDPSTPITIEIKQLRGKAKIRAFDYPGAEQEFMALREAFAAQVSQLAPRLRHRADASGYLASVVGDELEHFSMSALLPRDALPIAETLPLARAAVGLAHETGALDRELTDLLAMLAQMETALAAPQKARLFSDLAAQAAALDNVELELLDLRESLVARLAERSGSGDWKRPRLRKEVDEPTPGQGMSRHVIVSWLEHLGEKVLATDRAVTRARAELVAIERGFAGAVPRLDGAAQGTFFAEAGALRSHLTLLQAQGVALRHEIRRMQTKLRFDDPHQRAAEVARNRYRDHLQKAFAKQSQRGKDPDGETLWRQIDALQERCLAARTQLEEAASARLTRAQGILEEERRNLDLYRAELQGKRAEVQQNVGEVMAAVLRDVVVELSNLVVRSEVGLLDVAWAKKEAEATEATRLEKARDVDLGEIDRSVEMGMEAVRR